MPQPFNPTHAVRFDVGRGRVSVDGSEARVLVPAEALVVLCKEASPEAVKDFGRHVGTEIGRRVAARVGDSAPIAAMVEHLGGDLALAGLGSLGVEVWGKALVITVTESPLGADGDLLVAAVFEGALQRALARDTAVVPLQRADGKVRLVVLSPAAATSVRKWLAEGVSWGDALTRLSPSA